MPHKDIPNCGKVEPGSPEGSYRSTPEKTDGDATCPEELVARLWSQGWTMHAIARHTKLSKEKIKALLYPQRMY